MKRMLLGAVIAIVFAAISMDEVRLHRLVQRQSGALEQLTAEVNHLQRATADQGKHTDTARKMVLIPNSPNATTNGSATLFGVLPRNDATEDAVPFATPFLQNPPSRVPPSWQPFEFNGQTYYRIPLANASPEPFGFRP